MITQKKLYPLLKEDSFSSTQIANLFYGISLGSILLLAALGLAITFGLMGVINMAHGEMLMIGAYSTFVSFKTFSSHTYLIYLTGTLLQLFRRHLL